MTGLIWFVQIVHYPLMARAGADRFPAYEKAHTRLTTWVVAPPMIVEAVLVVLLAWGSWDLAGAWAGLGLLAAIWLSTAFLQVPMHRKLRQGFDEAAHGRLVSTNWIRTAAWSVRSILALYWLV